MPRSTDVQIFIIAIFLGMTLCFSGCKKDDTDTNRETLLSTTWDFKLIHSSSTSWHADVDFYEDGTTFYDEPDFPGVYIRYGTWTLDGDELFYILDSASVNTNYHFTGKMMGDSISGTYTFGSEPREWYAVPK